MTNLGAALPAGNGERVAPPHSLRVLVVDDERDTVLTLTALLRDEGHQVHGLHEGRHFASVVRAFDPQVVLIDISLPDASGFELARQVRRAEGGGRVLLIGISGQFREKADMVLSELAGFDHYLTKPYSPDRLLQLISEFAAAADDPEKTPTSPQDVYAERPRSSDAYRQAVAHAAGLVGGMSALSKRLEVPRTELERWATGVGKPPIGVFLKVVDVLLSESAKRRN